MHPDDIKRLIEASLPDAQVEVRGDDGVHFEATVVSPAFTGKTPLQQHRLVYAALSEPLGSGALHALALRTYTPEAWQQRQ